MDMTFAPSAPAHLSARALDDYRLVQTAISGCQHAYAALLKRYRPAVYHLMFQRTRNGHDAADLTMEAFGKAFRRLAAYAPTHAFSTWLFRIALNNCIDHARRKRIHVQAVGDTYAVDSADFSLLNRARTDFPTPEDDIIRRQRIDLMQGLQTRLSAEHREMIDMRFYQDLSYEEMAERLSLPLGTVKARLHRAKEALYKMLQAPGAKAYLDRTRRMDDEGEAPGASL